ncbi:MAG: TrkA family potassium uptake protein [Candidatus Pacebacteria bacterium]|nr:TrkA family potassium uptake protein [Candidatus Paceibacterota bacterium]
MRQIAVVGLGRFGRAVALELVDEGAQVIGVDRNKDIIDEVKDSVTHAVALNATDEQALRALSLQDVDAAVVCIGVDVEANLLTTILLKKIGVKRIWARAINTLQQEILKALEVDSIINLEQEMGRLVARGLVIENVVRHIHLSPGYSVAEIKTPGDLVGQTLRDAKVRESYRVNVVAIKRKKPQITREGERTFEEYTENVPSPDTELEEDDVLVIVGNDRDIAQFSSQKKSS